MNSYSRMPLIAVSLAVAALGATQASAQVPMALAVPDAIVVATLRKVPGFSHGPCAAPPLVLRRWTAVTLEKAPSP